MLGYLAYTLLLIFPGLAAGLTLKLFVERRVVDILAISFGLSLVISPFLLLVGYALLGSISPTLVGLILGICIVGLLLFAIRNGVKLRMPSITKTELLALALVPLQGILLSLQFTKYPIFPATSSVDFRVHIQTALQFSSGQLPLSQVAYPPYVHLLMASLLSIESGITISIAQHSMVIIGTLAPLLVFVVVSKVLGDQKLGLAASIVFVLSGSVWYFSLFATGLYANFLGDLAALTVIFLLNEALESFDFRRGMLLLVGGLALYFSHYTTILFVAALWVGVPFFWRKARDRFVKYVKASGLITLPGFLLVIARPNIISQVLSLGGLTGAHAGVITSGDDALANFLSSFSFFLYYLYQQIGIGLFVLTIISVPLCIYISTKGANAWIPTILVWFFLTWLTSPNSTIAWRYSTLAVIPLIFLWPLSLQTAVLPKRSFDTNSAETVRRRKRVRDTSETKVRLFFFFAVTLILLYGTPLGLMVYDLSSASENSAVSQNQRQVYDALQWVGMHASPGSNVMGLEDWRFSYLTPVWGQSITVYSGTSAIAADGQANSSGFSLIIVSRYLVPGPQTTFGGPNANFAGFQAYPRFSSVYVNPSVEVYSVKH